VRRTVTVCALLAVGSVATLSLLGQPPIGFALGAGLVIGSLNGFMAKYALGSALGFGASSLGRLGLLTAAGLVAALIFGVDTAVWVLAGLAAAQLVQAGLAVAEAVRA